MAVSKSRGNMYKWVTHTWCPFRGGCPHECIYCYVKSGRAARFYTGDIALSEAAMNDNLGKGRTIFVAHMIDMFAEGVPSILISMVLKKLRDYPKNTYLLQTKNPHRIMEFVDELPKKVIFATTIETDDDNVIRWTSKTAPLPMDRAGGLSFLKSRGYRTELTIEPILKFDLERFKMVIDLANPDSISIGADSKGHGMPEPTAREVLALIEWIKKRGYKIEEEKHNLGRIFSTG